MRHAITVARLRELLAQLRDDDELQPNAVANMSIIRRGAYVGFVDLLEGHQSVHEYEAEIR